MVSRPEADLLTSVAADPVTTPRSTRSATQYPPSEGDSRCLESLGLTTIHHEAIVSHRLEAVPQEGLVRKFSTGLSR